MVEYFDQVTPRSDRPPAAPPASAPLTASERRIAELDAEGLTNREIAQTLFVTARTVEGHLTNVFNKLDVQARTALPAALAAPTLAVRA